jgi:hypothetical protein
MKELRSLFDIYTSSAEKMNHYEGNDFELPQTFKNQVTEINNSKVIYNKYSAIVETKGYQHGVLNIFMPNQWFYIASYFTDFYEELMQYKKYALMITTKDRLKEISDSHVLNDQELSNLQNLELTEASKNYLKRFITDYDWWKGAKTIDRGDFYVSPILNCARLVNASQSYVADLCAFLSDKKDLVELIIQKGDDSNSNIKKETPLTIHLSKQIIYYGAPGTGKSFAINNLTKGKHVIRTTFHPDSDYSTFVGAYKPTTKESFVRDSTGRVVVENGMKVTEDRIVYNFVEQAFLQAYVNAWKLYAAAANENEAEPQFLVIEEINRGNCAQIFGDLFQLLDRKDNGFSEYPITADADMQSHLAKAFKNLDIPNAEAIDNMYDEPGIAEKIKNGEVLLLPSNLYIWATMNTSDQSLFPIDSAFKRRWEWKYVPISKGIDKDTHEELNWRIKVNNGYYDWWSFLEEINGQIDSLTSSQDKKLGYFFCKAKDGIITAEQFVDKVLFFLWNEVLKDYEREQPFLKNGNDYLTFEQFYEIDDTGNTSIKEDKVELLLNNLGVNRIESDSNIPADVDDDNQSSELEEKYLKFWQGFNASYEESGEFKEIFTNPKGLKQTWLNIGGLRRKYYIALIVLAQKRVARIQLYFPNHEKEYEVFVDEIDRMQEELGMNIEKHEANKCSYLQIERPFDIDKDDPNIVYQWYHEKSVVFKRLCDEIDPKE